MPREWPPHGPEYQDRLARTRAYMQRTDLDLLLVYQPEQYNWLSGYEPTSTFFYQVLIVPRDEQPVTLMCNKAELALCEETCWVDDVRVLWTYEDQVAGDARRPARAKPARRRSPSRPGACRATTSSHATRSSCEPRCPASSSSTPTQTSIGCGWSKSETKIDHLRRAAHRRSRRRCGHQRDPRGRDRSRCHGRGPVRRGPERRPVPGLSGSGRRARHVDRTPIGRILKPGDVIYLEVDGVVRRYHCNISRSVVIGPPSDGTARMYEVVLRRRFTGPPTRCGRRRHRGCRGPGGRVPPRLRAEHLGALWLQLRDPPTRLIGSAVSAS